MKKMLSILAIALPFINAPAYADEPPTDNSASRDAVQTIEVDGIKNPLLHPYRALWAGMDAFDKYRQLAPAATLRFKLSERINLNKYAINTDGLNMRIVGNETSLPVSIDSDGTFSIPRNQAVFDDNADLILNKKKQLYEGMPDIRTPGVPPNMRRLGDLRLDCRIIEAIAKKEINFVLRAALNIVLFGSAYESSRAQWWFDAPGRLASATIVSGDRRQALDVARYAARIPIADKSWPDDALIEFQLSGPIGAEYFAQQPIYLFGSMNNWRTANLLRKLDATTYSADIALSKGAHTFKVGSTDWKAIDFGSGVYQQEIVLGSGQGLTEVGANMTIKVEHPATFTFKLDVSKPTEPSLTVTRTDVGG